MCPLQFYIKYQTDSSSNAADTLSHCSQSDNEGSRDASSEKYEAVFYATTCEETTNVINGKKLPIELK